MRDSDFVTTLARFARRVPVGRQATRRMIERLRSSPTARKVVSRIFDFDDSGIGGTVFVGAGNVIAGQGLDNLPVILVNLVGAHGHDVPDLVEEVAQEQLLTGGFRPVFLIDGDYFSIIRQYGYPVEHVIDRNSWSEEAGSWQEYLAQRLRQMRRVYSASGMVDLVHARQAGLLFLSTIESTG